MKRFVFLVLLFLAVSAKRGKKSGKKDTAVLPGCELGDLFDCSRQHVKSCKSSGNIKAIRQYCFAMRGHDSMMEQLQDIFEEKWPTRQNETSRDNLSRSARMLEPLDEGYVSETEFDEAASCSIGGGTITTFDGYSHTLTAGACTYALTLDRTISELVVYGIFKSHRDGKYANRLSRVAIYIDRTSLVLGEDFDINYQGMGYNAPARINDKLVVWRDKHYIYAKAEDSRVLVRWDPVGQLKISVSPRYINKTIGLCGMFNGDNSSAGEHNTLKHNSLHQNPEMSPHDFGKAWALAGCFHEDTRRLKERMRNCNKRTFSRLCSVTHAAPQLAECLGDREHGKRYRQECVRSLCICDHIESCMYSEALRISNACYDRLGKKIGNIELENYLSNTYIKNMIPSDYQEVPTEVLDTGDEKNYGQPYSYRDFKPAGTCYVYAHNHVQTFDGVNYQTDAHGCSYPLSLEKGIQDFAVYGTFQAEDARATYLAPHLAYVSFFDIKNRVRVQLGQGLEVNYEGRSVPLPYLREFVSIWYDDDENQVYIYDHELGVEVRWDGESVARIRLDSRYVDQTKGLCGTFNMNDRDDINLLKNTRLTPSSFQVMVKEWKLPGCVFNANVHQDPTLCVPSQEHRDLCRTALTDVKFSFCVTDLPPIHFIERCEQDLCRCTNSEECKCEIVSAYAQICQDILNTGLKWRADDFCPRNMCLFKNNECKHKCSPPGVCSCEPGFNLGADGKSCIVEIRTFQ